MFETVPVPILQMKNIWVSYDSQPALKGVDFDLHPGEIHAVVGEHRAGKSTLVKLLSGVVVKDEGRMLFKGQSIEYFTTKSAIQQKIGMMYQHLNVIPTMNAVQNIFAGRDIATWYGSLKRSTMIKQVQEFFADMNVDIPLNVPLKFLSQAQQHMIELAKVLSINPEILIFDEIANKFTPHEMEYIYKLLFTFKQQGKSVIYISHDRNWLRIDCYCRDSIRWMQFSRRSREYVRGFPGSALYHPPFKCAGDVERFHVLASTD